MSKARYAPELGHMLRAFRPTPSKDPKHLRLKLARMAEAAEGRGVSFDIDETNVFSKVQDLAGVRLLHLYSRQMEIIHPAILASLKEFKTNLVSDPVAYTWDIETEKFFESLGIKPQEKSSMYTSVHYVVEANRETQMTCEIQVRSLMEEVWGEVSHRVDYPFRSNNIECQEQLKVLARFTSGCSRLVDSIFLSHQRSQKKKNKSRQVSQTSGSE